MDRQIRGEKSMRIQESKKTANKNSDCDGDDDSRDAGRLSFVFTAGHGEIRRSWGVSEAAEYRLQGETTRECFRN